MPTFVWNLDTNVVSGALTDQTTAQYQSARGNSDLRLILARGGISDATEVQLDTATPSAFVVGFVLRAETDPDVIGELTPETLLTRGAGAADGYIGTTTTDTDPVQKLQSVAVPGTNQTPVTASGVFYYEPAGGGPAVESQPFSWTITPKYHVTGAPPAPIVETWPSPAQLNAAIAQAVAGVHNGDSPNFAGLLINGATHFAGAVDFPPDGAITQDGGDLSGAILTIGSTGSLLDPVFASGPLQGIRRNAANTRWETYAINTGDGSAFTNLNPTNLSGPVAIAKGGTGAATATAALTALGAEASANKGAANGYAPLGSDTKIAAAYLPSYVDDVLEFANLAALPGTGETGKIYVTLDTNFEYRWSGSTYIRIVASPGSTDALVEGVTNLYFSNARALAATASAYLAPTGSGASLTGVVKAHPILTGAGGPSGNGTTMVGGTGVLIRTAGGTGTTTGYPVYVLSDTCGTVIFEFNQDVTAGSLVATITFATAYTAPLPADVMFCPVVLDHTKTSQGVANPGYVAALEARMTTTALNIYASADGVGSGSWLAYRYSIPPV